MFPFLYVWPDQVRLGQALQLSDLASRLRLQHRIKALTRITYTVQSVPGRKHTFVIWQDEPRESPILFFVYHHEVVSQDLSIGEGEQVPWRPDAIRSCGNELIFLAEEHYIRPQTGWNAVEVYAQNRQRWDKVQSLQLGYGLGGSQDGYKPDLGVAGYGINPILRFENSKSLNVFSQTYTGEQNQELFHYGGDLTYRCRATYVNGRYQTTGSHVVHNSLYALDDLLSGVLAGDAQKIERRCPNRRFLRMLRSSISDRLTPYFSFKLCRNVYAVEVGHGLKYFFEFGKVKGIWKVVRAGTQAYFHRLYPNLVPKKRIRWSDQATMPCTTLPYTSVRR